MKTFNIGPSCLLSQVTELQVCVATRSLCGSGDWIKSFANVRQTLYQLKYIPSEIADLLSIYLF